jgi:hypothetical protein
MCHMNVYIRIYIHHIYFLISTDIRHFLKIYLYTHGIFYKFCLSHIRLKYTPYRVENIQLAAALVMTKLIIIIIVIISVIVFKGVIFF